MTQNNILEDFFSQLDNRQETVKKPHNCTILITGSTGLVGSMLVQYFLHLNEAHSSDIQLILPVRNEEKARALLPASSYISYVPCADICELNYSDIESYIKKGNQYVIHCAAPTKSKFLNEHPQEVQKIIVDGTRTVLDIATQLPHCEKFIYLSSMEVYGTLDDKNVTENTPLPELDKDNSRNSYPIAKRAAETLCQHAQNIDTAIVRLAMCFGPGVLSNETRSYKAFIDDARNNNDVILKTTGATVINFINTIDMIAGVVLLLGNGEKNGIYNICYNSNSQKTIRDMALQIAAHYNRQVQINITSSNDFPADNKMQLSNEKIKALGFNPQYDLYQTIEQTIEYVEAQKD